MPSGDDLAPPDDGLNAFLRDACTPSPVNVKSAVYSSMPLLGFVLLGVLGQPHLEDRMPFASTVFFVVTWILSLQSANASASKTLAGEGRLQ